MKGFIRNMPEQPKFKPITLEALAQQLGLTFEGKKDTLIQGAASLTTAKPGDLVFLADKKFRTLLQKSPAAAAIVPYDEPPLPLPVMRAPNPYLSFVQALEIMYQPYRPQPGIHPTASIHLSATIGPDVSIGAGCVIGEKVVIGAKTIIFPLVSIYPQVTIGEECLIHSLVTIREDTQIGRRVVIQPGAVIGADGFGFLQDEAGRSRRIPQVGRVVIEDDVEIGANTTIDRAALEVTLISRGVKIDNLVQIAHNVTIGPDTIIAAQTGIAGSTKIGQRVIMGGQVGLTDHIEIGDEVLIAAKTGVTKSVPEGTKIAGSPHLNIMDWRKAWVSIPQLYDLLKNFRRLQRKVQELEEKLAGLNRSTPDD
ncbi:MAG: UDP-3-O-(3-hydroxymyristoyl)glucosamine N-acyltransferase [Candidatus Aminicenantes bacterium 4484_214]|nr:MAG: UDP-3-O-(3-hydroxymyristoyl)glucosamine N-acyltransferase [Candidatus Aminicenantes bacterium 4484_214]